MGNLLLKWVLPGWIGLSFLLASSSPLPAAESPRERIQHLLRLGVEKGLNLDEPGAVLDLTRAIELDPRNPVGYAYLAMAHLFFYETGFSEREKRQKEAAMLRAIEEALARGEKRIEKDSKDAEAHLAVAMAKMVKNRWEILRRNYFRALREAQGIGDLLHKARELSPENSDVYYPLGVLHYHLSQLPGVARWITSLFLIPGDREKGIQELETAYQKGRLLKDLAASSLVAIYSGDEKQPARALPLARKLKETYPNNFNYSFALAGALSELGLFEEALSLAGDLEKGILSGRPPYRTELRPRQLQLLGKIALDQGDYERAAPLLRESMKDEAPYNARVRAWALVRLGMIHDARKERIQAEELYQRALDLEGAEGTAKRRAREYLEAPYVPPPRKP